MGWLNLLNSFSREKPSKSSQGSFYEDKACRYLQRQGFRLIEKNFRSRMGEIDLIMREGEFLVFVEVRSRTHFQRLSSLASIGPQKQRRLKKTAQYYLQIKNLSLHPCRFDAVGFDDGELRWVRAAF